MTLKIELLRRIAAAMGLTALVGLAVMPLAAAQAPRPNIIFLLTDDHRWDSLGCMGNPILQTPNMDRLAREGTLFQNAYVTTSICCTSRASILTGQYARRHGIWDFVTEFTPEQLALTYPMLLRQAGYRTGFIGKYGVGLKNHPKDQFDYWKVDTHPQPFYETTDEEGKPIHLTRLIDRQICEFIDGSTAGQPFCLSVSFKAPHVQDGDPRQYIPDPAYAEMYRDVTIPEPVTAAESYWMRFPQVFRQSASGKLNESRERWKLRFTSEKYQQMVKAYYQLLWGVDVAIADLRQALAAKGLAENTVIVLLGDNGQYLGEHSMAGKWYGHEESVRVPLIVYDPRVPEVARGQVRSEMALNIDIAPTFLALAGIPIPAGMEGADLTPIVQGGRPAGWRTDFLYEHFLPTGDDVPAAGSVFIPGSQGVISTQYKYTQYPDLKPQFEELYDVSEDPFEIHNRADDPDYAEVKDRMIARMQELIAANR